MFDGFWPVVLTKSRSKTLRRNPGYSSVARRLSCKCEVLSLISSTNPASPPRNIQQNLAISRPSPGVCMDAILGLEAWAGTQHPLECTMVSWSKELPCSGCQQCQAGKPWFWKDIAWQLPWALQLPENVSQAPFHEAQVPLSSSWPLAATCVLPMAVVLLSLSA